MCFYHLYVYICVCVCVMCACVSHLLHNQGHKLKSPDFINVSPCYLDDGWFYHEKTSYDVQNFMTLRPLNTKNSETTYQGSLEREGWVEIHHGLDRFFPIFVA